MPVRTSVAAASAAATGSASRRSARTAKSEQGARRRLLGRAQVGGEQRERSGARRQLRRRRLGRPVEQRRLVGDAANLNGSHQDADQHQAGGAGIAIQAIGQSASNDQDAVGAVGGAAARRLEQQHAGAGRQRGRRRRRLAVEQRQLGRDGAEPEPDEAGRRPGTVGQRGAAARDAIGIQAIGQEAKNGQGALAASLAAQVGGRQCGCGSDSTPQWDGLGSQRLNPVGTRWMLE